MKFSYNIDNNDIRDELLECSLLQISLLLKLYKENKIDLSTFKNHSYNKIAFIQNNFDTLNESAQKLNAEDIINECVEISNKHY